MDLQRRKERVALLSIVSNSVLVVLKLCIGMLIGAVSIVSEAIHSGVDLVAAIIAFFAVRQSGVPADEDHPFGHGKIENISGTIEALLIFVAAGWIIYEAVGKLIKPEPLEKLGWGVGVMLVSTGLNIWVSQKLFAIGKEADSIALQADAWHLRTDVYTSGGVMASLTLIWMGGLVSPESDFQWLDPVAAIGVALLIFKAAYELTCRSLGGLMDVTLPKEEEHWIRQAVIGQRPAIHGYHQLRTRKAGQFRFVEFHIKVDPWMSVEESHRITEVLTDEIKKTLREISITIHTEPCDGDCVAKCLEGCLLPESERRAMQQRLA
jgi:cation diffusion facilitator family transporter